MRLLFYLRLGVLYVAVTCLPAAASVLDWDNETYTPNGALTQSYTNVDGSGVTMNFSFSGNTGAFVGGSPALNTFNTGGLNPPQDSLLMFVDFGGSFTNQFIRLDITFSQDVSDVSFSIFDIDFGAGDFQDLIVAAAFDDGALQAPGTRTTSVDNRTTNAGDFAGTIFGGGAAPFGIIGTSPAANNTSDGNGTYNFGSTVLDQISIFYTNGPSAPLFPGDQAVSLHDINFTVVVPEAKTYWAMAGMGLIVLGLELRRRRRSMCNG